MNGAHVHLLLNHIPILGVLFALLLLSAAMPRRSQVHARLALQVIVAAALLAIPVYLSGEPAEQQIERLRPSAEAVVEAHESAALGSLAAVELLGFVAAGALWSSRRSRELGYRSLVTIWAGALLVSASVAWTAYLGGQIAHPEIRTAPQGVVSDAHGSISS